MMNEQSYAIEIEHIIKDVFSCERLGFEGVVDSNFIRSQPFTAIIVTLAYQFATADENQRYEIEKFIEDKSFYSNFSIDKLLSFKASEKVIDGAHIDIEFPSGEKAIKKIIMDFKKAVE